ncbi:MAG: integrase arm-type DNA-binding domain-containing protein [Azoarcus sp.]|nr:integrase arm-type DNA-binding domain-containing protein [Azoarcus sp.]
MTATAIRAIKPVKHSGSGDSYLLQHPAGGKRKTLALGAYPAVSLKNARVRRDEAKKPLANNQDPGEVKKARKAAIHAAHNNSFEAVARAWFEKWETEVTASTAKSQKERLAEHITPVLGNAPSRMSMRKRCWQP